MVKKVRKCGGGGGPHSPMQMWAFGCALVTAAVSCRKAVQASLYLRAPALSTPFDGDLKTDRKLFTTKSLISTHSVEVRFGRPLGR